MTRRGLQLLPFLLASLLLVPSGMVPQAHAAGTVSISPSTVALGNTNDTFTVNVRVDNIALMNGWDIMVQTDPTVINATSVSIAGTILGVSTQQVGLCVNGVLVIGPKCSPGDGPGVVHSAAAALGPAVPNVNGPLFTITYKVVNGAATYSPIHLPIEIQGDVVITDGTSNTVMVATVDGTYGSLTPQPDFTITALANSGTSNLIREQSLNVTFLLTGLNGIADVVTLDASSNPTGLRLSFNDTMPTVLDGVPVASMLTINTTSLTPTTYYQVTVTGTPTMSRSHKAGVTVTVVQPGDYLLALTSYLLRIPAQGTASTTITLSSEGDFTDTILLGVRSDTAGVSAVFNTTRLLLPAGGTARATLTVTTPPANITFHYTLAVTANATHSQMSVERDLFVTPPPGDIGLTVSSLALTMRAGSSSSLAVTLASSNYYKGIAYLVATSISGIRLSYSDSTIPLSYYNETFSGIHWVTVGSATLTVSADASIPSGDHQLVLAVLSGTLSHSITVIITITNSSSTSSGSSSGGMSGQKLILGFQPLTYFGIIAALAIFLAVAAFREVRRPKSYGRRAFLEDSTVANESPKRSQNKSKGRPFLEDGTGSPNGSAKAKEEKKED